MRANYRINWKSGMRLSDAVFNASDEFHISQLLPLYGLMLRDGYGHITQPRFRCETDNAEMSVIEMNVTALTPDGGLIHVMFDHNERDLFQNIPMPEQHDPFIVYLEQSTSDFDTFEDKDIPYRSGRMKLIFKAESTGYANPDAVAVARFEFKQCWVMDNSFIPPCVMVKANADLWNQGHVYSRLLSDLASLLPAKASTGMGMEALSLIPAISMLSTEIRKEMDGMSPKHLVTVMQQALGAIISVFQTGMADCIPEHDACLEYVNAEYVPTRIAALVDEGIRLTRILQQMVAELRPQAAPQPEPAPMPAPQPVRVARQPRTPDTSSERRSFKSRK